MALAFGLEDAPALEGTEQPRRHVRVEAIDLERLGGEKPVTGSVGTIEAGRVRVDEAADQRADSVGVLQREFGVGEEACTVSTEFGRAARACTAKYLSSTRGSSCQRA